MASAATLVGLETPAQSKNLELKPYAVSSATTNRTGAVAVRQRRDGQRRLRLQVRADAQPDRRRHLAHRLRAGRRGPAADQPDALQPVLPREARLLHRRPGHLRLRRRAGRQQPGRRAAAVLQPADRAEPGPGRAGARRRAADRTRRRVQHRRAQHPDRRRARGRRRRHQLLGAAPQAQPAPPQQRRRDGDPARARRSAGAGRPERRRQLHRRRRRHDAVLQEHQPHRATTRGPARPTPRGAQRRPAPAIAAASTTPTIATAPPPSTC